MSLRVLIVDDEPLARVGVPTRLDAHAFISVMGECGDGASALAFLQSQSPDLPPHALRAALLGSGITQREC